MTDRIASIDDLAREWHRAINKHDMPAPIYRASVLDAMSTWPKGANGPLAISAYESLVERLIEFDAVMSAARISLAEPPYDPLSPQWEDCKVCGEPGALAGSKAHARCRRDETAEPGLDVERMARALLAWSGTSPLNPSFSVTASANEMARAIAREYALRSETPEAGS